MRLGSHLDFRHGIRITHHRKLNAVKPVFAGSITVDAGAPRVFSGSAMYSRRRLLGDAATVGVLNACDGHFLPYVVVPA